MLFFPLLITILNIDSETPLRLATTFKNPKFRVRIGEDDTYIGDIKPLTLCRGIRPLISLLDKASTGTGSELTFIS